MSKLDEIESYLSKMTKGPWDLWESNSWRRFGSQATGQTVIEPIPYSKRDNHPDLYFTNRNDTNIARLRTDAEYLVRRCEALEKALRDLRELIRGHDINCPCNDGDAEEGTLCPIAEAERVLKQE